MILIIAFLLAVCLPLETSLAKKPAKEPPPVQYHIHLIYPPVGGQRTYVSDLNDCDINENPRLVGYYRTYETNVTNGFVYDYDPDVSFGVARDLNNEVVVPSGWRIKYATAVNSWGDIVGCVVDENDVEFACFIHMNAPTPFLEVIDLDEEDFGTLILSKASNINSSGDIVGFFQRAEDETWGVFLYNPGLYGNPKYDPVEFTQPADPQFRDIHWWLRINQRVENVFQLAGQTWMWVDGSLYERFPFRCDIEIPDGESIEPIIREAQILELGPDRREFGALWVADINNAGLVLGEAIFRVGKGNKTAWRVFRHDGGDIPEYLSSGATRSMNDNGDFVTTDRIYLDRPLPAPHEPGYFYPEELIDPADPYLPEWLGSVDYRLWEINNRAGEFGQIAGDLRIDTELRVSFVLTPTE